jgi:hypothetical protein
VVVGQEAVYKLLKAWEAQLKLVIESQRKAIDRSCLTGCLAKLEQKVAEAVYACCCGHQFGSLS